MDENDENVNLVEVFLRHARVPVIMPDDPAEAEELLRDAWRRGRNSWLELDVPPKVFVKYLAERLGPDHANKPLAWVLEDLSLGLVPFYLLSAFASGVWGADKTLKSEIAKLLRGILNSLKLPPEKFDEVYQKVLIHLLVGGAGGRDKDPRPPRLMDYQGKGKLSSWIQVIAIRMALVEITSGHESSDEKALTAFSEAPSPEPDPEIEISKKRNLEAFRQALRESFKRIPRELRYLLRLYYFDRLTTIQLGALFGQDQSSISRKLKAARDAVLDLTKQILREHLNLSSDGVESFLQELDSQFGVSLSLLIQEEDERVIGQALREVLASGPDDQRRLLRAHLELLRSGAEPSKFPPELKAVLETVFGEVMRLLRQRFDMEAKEFKALQNYVRAQLGSRISQILEEQSKKEGT